MTSKRRRRTFLLTVVLIVANLVLLNWIGTSNYDRFDLTRDKVFTLHPATVELLGGLDDIVSITAYISKKQFEEKASNVRIPREVRDKIDEFAAQARG